MSATRPVRRPEGRSARRPAVVPVFAAMPGRARLRVEGLRGKRIAAARMEDRLATHPAVREVRASPLTGNVLILFDPARLPLRGLLAEVTRHVQAPRDGARWAAAGALDGWHALDSGVVMRRLGTSADGLATEEATRRLATVGANRLPVPQPRSALEIVAGHLTSVPVLVLAVAAALSLATGGIVESAVIMAVVAANAAVGYLTESRVERVMQSLQNATVPEALARRDGRDAALPASTLVPGDVIVLKAGQDVPADARLLNADGLVVDESALTGESAPVEKAAAAVGDHSTPLAERASMVYSGTVVAQGSAVAVVTGTGRESELGRVRTLVAETSAPPTPVERQLDRTGRSLVAISLGCCAGALGLGLLRGVALGEMLRTTISLAVAAVPEGLPAVATTTLALGVQRMFERRMVVRRLAAVEGLGATTVICADKTGTLTENRMRVAAWHVGDCEYAHPPAGRADPALESAMVIGALCNEAEIDEVGRPLKGSATETALLAAAQALGVDYRTLRARYRLLGIRPRLEGEHWMATVHEDGTRRLLAVKGAPEHVLARAAFHREDGALRPLTAERRQAILRANAHMAGRGLRVLGLASRVVEPECEESYDDLTWVGLVGLTDPVRRGVREAIAACRNAGIRTVIITGDQARTAAAVCRELDLVRNGHVRVVEAAHLALLDEAGLREEARHAHAFARVSPAHKYQIVRALQTGGEVVAMTGDGINDAAALKAADIGVAMGARGTEVARDVADVVLLDDDFGSIVQAVQHGRTTHTNIRKVLTFLLGSNFSEILVTVAALAVGFARPMSPIQFLWLNLVSDVLPALALALEPPEPDVMARPPRDPAEPMLSGRVLARVGADAALLAAGTLGVYHLALARYGPGARAGTLAFETLTSAQLLYALSCRSERRSGFSGLHRNPLLAGVVGGSLGLQILAVAAPPLRRLLGTTPLSAADWGLVAAGVAMPLAVRELARAAAVRDGNPRSHYQRHTRR